jgi:PDZ domain-containing protein
MSATAESEVRLATPRSATKKPTVQICALNAVAPVYTTEILHLSPTYENRGLKIGDQILAVDGVQVKSAEQIDDLLFRLHPHSTLAVTVRRVVNGSSRILNIPVPMHAAAPERFGWITVLGLRVFLPLVADRSDSL